MSCDHNRARLFDTLAETVAPLVGSLERAGELLELVYDVASQQPPPEDKAAQLAARAAYQKLKARAAREGIDLYPHQSVSGLPAPEAVAAWKQVSDLLDTVEHGKPLSPLAADAQQVTAFRRLLDEGPIPWNVPLRGATLLQMRQRWAAEPERVRLLMIWPEALAGPEHAALLSELTGLLADDPTASPDLSAAARHAQALDDEGMLDGAERERWVRVLACAAGIGRAEERVGVVPCCPTCGEWLLQDRHVCDPDDIRDAGEVAAAVAAVLADPDYLLHEVDPSPYAMLALVPDRWARTGRSPSTEAEVRLHAMAYRVDRRRMLRIATGLAAGDPTFDEDARAYPLRDVTMRTPVMFDGAPHIWADGRLFRRDDYLEVVADQWRGVYHDEAALTKRAVAHVSAATLMFVLAGVKPPMSDQGLRRRFRFSERARLERFGRARVPVNTLIDGDLMIGDSCGCVFRCVATGSRGGGTLLRIATTMPVTTSGGKVVQEVSDPKSCVIHPPQYSFTARERRKVWIVDNDAPRFDLPSWPAPTPEAPEEAASVV